MTRFLRSRIHLVVLAFWLGTAPARADSYTVAVPPQFNPTETHKRWQPLLNRLSYETGLEFKLRPYQTLPPYEIDTMNGAHDFVFMNPYLQAIAHRTPGYIPLVRDSSPLHGALLVKKDGPIRSLRDLQGREMAFPSASALVASAYMRGLLIDREGLQFRERYVGSHSNVARNVAAGLVAGGGVSETAYKKEPEELRNQLVVLWRTPGVAPHPLSAHPRVPAAVRETVTRAILGLTQSEEGRRLLSDIQIPQPVRADYARDYRPIEALHLERFGALEGGR